ncbi:thiamine pyrophosphate-binding protein [Bradyrhizobium glycinis]|uniref:thiamine pyrophosphate-binding protein n=1 Tax=Bradyrhizobium glycinis TaxID=2751812 RepID=UPI0024BFE9C2|nr:thiamine pyrophosphate-binding protein [Bradyrhizobium glycinis]
MSHVAAGTAARAAGTDPQSSVASQTSAGYTPPRDGGRLLVEELLAHGVDAIFGLEGGHIDPILHAAREAGMKMIDVRHEAVAGYAAEGYFRITGKPAVSLVTAGPGFANSLTGMAGAFLDRIPVLFVSGAAPTREPEMNALQGGFDQVAMARPVTKWADRATSIKVIGPMVRAALRAMFAGAPGPAFLEIPIDVVFGDGSCAPHPPPTKVGPPRTAPSPEAVSSALSLLENAERPVILVGSGALVSGCSQELIHFAERIGAPVYANVKALGLMPGTHPLACGSFITLARSSVSPDVVLILGARHGMFMGGASNDVIPADARVIQVDVDHREIGRIHPAHVPIVADCRETLAAFLRDRRHYPNRTQWTKEAAAETSWHEKRYAEALNDDGSDMHPYRVLREMANFVDEKTVVIAEGGDAGAWAEVVLGPRAAGPGHYFGIGYFGNLGMHQGLAIGTQLARPDLRVICVTGDGSAGFQMQELDTMVRHRLPIVTVVFNDRAWGMSRNYMINQPRGSTWVDLGDNLRYDQVCEACGGHGEFVTSSDQLPGALARALKSGRTACVNVFTRSAVSPKSEQYTRLGKMGEIVLPYYRDPDA